MRVGRSFTSILSGALLASGLCVTLPVAHAAEKKAAHPGPDAKVVFGIVTAKTDKDITIKAEGEDEAKRYLLAPKGGAPQADLQAALKMVFPTNLVMFQSQGEEEAFLGKGS